MTQYASLLNGPIKSAQSAWQDYQTNCDIDGDQFACTVGIQTVGLSAQNLGLTIDLIEVNHGPQDTDYFGSSPAEIAQLTEDTRTAANKLAGDLTNLDKPAQGWGFDALELSSTLDRWGRTCSPNATQNGRDSVESGPLVLRCARTIEYRSTPLFSRRACRSPSPRGKGSPTS